METCPTVITADCVSDCVSVSPQHTSLSVSHLEPEPEQGSGGSEQRAEVSSICWFSLCQCWVTAG